MSAPRPRPAGPLDRGRDAWLLAGVAAAYLPGLWLGFGADDDAYRLVRAGRHLVGTGVYEMSRTPGYPVVEAATGVLDALGGSLATNAGTLAMALVAVASLLGIARRLGVPHARALAAAFALQPLMWANASVTMDHVWALGFVLAGWRALLGGRGAWAGVLLGLAVGSRLTAALAVAAVLGHALATGDRRAALQAGAVAGVVAAACVALPAWEAGWTLAFLQPAWLDDPAVWTPAMRLGRWGYKSVYVWGLFAAAGLLATAALAVAERARLRPQAALLGLVAAVVVLYHALYLRYPLDRTYLLPTVPFVLLGAGVVLAERPRVLAALLGVVVLYNAVSLDLARPDRPFAATGAAVGLWVAPGYLADQVRIRIATRGCETVACWAARTGYVGADENPAQAEP